MRKTCEQKCECNLEDEVVFKYSLLIKVEFFLSSLERHLLVTQMCQQASQVNIDFS